MALVLRKKKDGSVYPVSGEMPEVHEFSARWIERSVQSGLASVVVTLHMGDEDHVYNFKGFAELEDENEEGGKKLNFTGWRCEALGYLSDEGNEQTEEEVIADDAEDGEAA